METENEEKVEQETISDDVVKEIENHIGNMSDKNRQAVIKELTEKFTSKISQVEKEKIDMKGNYEKELSELQQKYGLAEKKYTDYLSEIDKRISEMNKKFEDTWANYQPQRQGLTNTSENPFKNKTSRDIVKEIGDPRKWSEDPALKKQLEAEFMQILDRTL